MFALISIKQDGEMKIEKLHLDKSYLEAEKSKHESYWQGVMERDVQSWGKSFEENPDNPYIKESYEKALKMEPYERYIIKRIVLED